MPGLPCPVYNRFHLILSVVALIPLGLWVRFQGPGLEWLNDAFGSILYELFWIGLVATIWPYWPPAWIAVGVCLVTCVLKAMQLLDWPLLQALQATWPGRLILGNTFTWSDFPPYFIGSSLGWVWLRTITLK